MNEHVFLRYSLLPAFSKFFNLGAVEIRECVQRFNNRLSLYIYPNDNERHHRPHAHILVNNNKIGWIWLDTFEIDSPREDRKLLNDYLKENKQNLLAAWERNNGKIDIDYFTYS